MNEITKSDSDTVHINTQYTEHSSQCIIKNHYKRQFLFQLINNHSSKLYWTNKIKIAAMPPFIEHTIKLYISIPAEWRPG